MFLACMIFPILRAHLVIQLLFDLELLLVGTHVSALGALTLEGLRVVLAGEFTVGVPTLTRALSRLSHCH